MALEDPYRGQAARCPGCGEMMNTRTVEGTAAVDCCARCGGAWLDWFDGSPPELARSLHPDSSGSARPIGPLMECPRCRASLEPEAFQNGPTVYRCGACFGLFVPKDFIAELARVEPKEAPQETSALRSFITRVRAVFGDD